MRFLATAAALVLVAPLLAAEPRAEWVKHSPTGTKAEVEMPGKAKETTSGGATQFVLEGKGGKTFYMFAARQMPVKVDITNKDAIKRIFDSGRTAVVTTLKGKLLSEKDITLGKYPGRARDIQTKLGIYRTRTYHTETKMFQLIAFGPKEFVEGADAKKFLDSLKINE
jgi:hypothetical protein